LGSMATSSSAPCKGWRACRSRPVPLPQHRPPGCLGCSRPPRPSGTRRTDAQASYGERLCLGPGALGRVHGTGRAPRGGHRMTRRSPGRGPCCERGPPLTRPAFKDDRGVAGVSADGTGPRGILKGESPFPSLQRCPGQTAVPVGGSGHRGGSPRRRTSRAAGQSPSGTFHPLPFSRTNGVLEPSDVASVPGWWAKIPLCTNVLRWHCQAGTGLGGRMTSIRNLL
jgi:hypothetical protein